MTLLHSAKTNFTAGEVTRRLLGRADLRSYENGALTLRNVAIHPTGGLSRRDGLRLVDEAAGDGRLIAFEFNTEQTYLLALTDRRLAIHRGDAKLAELPAPWTAAQLRRLAWTQSADTLLLCHPDVPPKRLTRRAGGAFQLDDWPFLRSGAVIRQPYARFAPPELTLKPSAATGAITLEASADLFEPGHAGTALRIAGKQVTITGLNGPRVAAARVDEALAGTAATADWQEAAFGPVRGWPATACFHQDRLVIGGSRDLPNRLWLSRAGDLWNFDLGTGEDDEAIEFALLSDQVNAVCAVFSGRHLQVFTSGGEWRVAGEPLTPATLRAERQTRIGSAADRHIPPVDVDGATLFVGRGGRELREFLYTDAEQAYQATDLALLARHLVRDPLDIAFDARRRQVLLVRADGGLACLTLYRAEQVAAWSLTETAGRFRSVAVVGETVHALVERGGRFLIERFDEAVATDSAVTGTAAAATATWSGLGHLDGRTVAVVADGLVRPAATVSEGRIVLDAPAAAVEAGLPFAHVVEPLPPGLLATGAAAQGQAVRLVEAVFRVEETPALRVDLGRGPRDVPLRRLVPGGVLDRAPQPVSGDVRLKALGWRRDPDRPLWRIAQDLPLPFTLLSVTHLLKVND